MVGNGRQTSILYINEPGPSHGILNCSARGKEGIGKGKENETERKREKERNSKGTAKEKEWKRKGQVKSRGKGEGKGKKKGKGNGKEAHWRKKACPTPSLEFFYKVLYIIQRKFRCRLARELTGMLWSPKS